MDPPLCRGSSQGKYGSCAKGLGCEGEKVGKIGEVSERTCACGQCQVRQGTGHDTWMTQRCAILSHACSRDDM